MFELVMLVSRISGSMVRSITSLSSSTFVFFLRFCKRKIGRHFFENWLGGGIGFLSVLGHVAAYVLDDLV